MAAALNHLTAVQSDMVVKNMHKKIIGHINDTTTAIRTAKMVKMYKVEETFLTHPPCLVSQLRTCVLRNVVMACWTLSFSSGQDFMT